MSKSTLLPRAFPMFLALVLAVVAAALAGSSLPARSQQQDHVPGEILVKFRDGIPVVDQSRTVAARGGAIVETQAVLGYVKVRLEDPTLLPTAVRALATDPTVEWAESNGYCYPAVCPTCPQDPYLVDLADGAPENQWGIFKTGVPFLWRHGGGGNPAVGIAILDTGIDDFASPHVDLAANVTGGHDFVDDDADPTDAGVGASLHGHGTHVAGIAAGVSNESGITGVAYCSSILVVRVLNCTAGDRCPGTFSDIADGIQWAADNGGDVINLSLSSDAPSDAIRAAIHYATGKGSIVIASSGNDFDDELRWPARYPESIAVGATDSADNVAGFSNYGPELDVVAPGVGIWSTYTETPYTSWDGTSMAAPFVSGVAALTLAANPKMRQAEMEQHLRDSAVGLAGGNAAKDGYGRVDFLKLQDWSDAPAGYATASHGLSCWERLGTDASAEKSVADADDADFRPNSTSDGYDDGIFPDSWSRLPFLPAHIGGAPVADVDMTVCRFDGPRYGPAPAKQLHLDVWADWDSDRSWEEGASGEHILDDHMENPATWGGNGLLTSLPFPTVDEHLLGNPVVFRSRLAYGASADTPGGAAGFGEVEDHAFINFVEDFDVSQRVHTPGLYTTGWGLISDPMPDNACRHHGDWEFAIAQHPSGPPCNNTWDGDSRLRTPAMDWREYTAGKIRFWYCHRYFNQCSPKGDNCRVTITTAESGTEILGPIPPGSGVVEFDVSHDCGKTGVYFEFIEETDWPGAVVIDDVTIWAFDGERSVAITDLALSRGAGSRQVDLSWTNQRENEHIPSPPADPLASINDFRYAQVPIVTEGDFLRATPFTKRDVMAGSTLPGAPGTAGSVSLRVPSAFQSYHVAMRTQDEVVTKSSLSNSPGDPGDSTLAMRGVMVESLDNAIAAPGDTAQLTFRITNTGNVSDSYSLSPGDTEGWDLAPGAGFTALGPGASDVFTLGVVVPGGAADAVIDTVRVTATSVADNAVSGADAGTVEVDRPASAPGDGGVPAIASLDVIGSNPFRESLSLELALPGAARASLRVHDPAGRLVRRIDDRPLPAGRHRFAWDGRDDAGREVASGAYLLEVRAGGHEWRTRITRVK